MMPVPAAFGHVLLVVGNEDDRLHEFCMIWRLDKRCCGMRRVFGMQFLQLPATSHFCCILHSMLYQQGPFEVEHLCDLSTPQQLQ